MNVLVLVCGIADPKWPLPAQPDGPSLQAHAARYAVMSPFDEAALELALKLRDADPAVTIAALVAGPETLARKVAEWRLDAVQRFDAGALAAWDARGYAGALAAAARAATDAPALLLCGREFGDFDDGSVPALLARELGAEHVALGLAVQQRADALWASRQRGGVIENVRLRTPSLLSVTNDSHNRLRHPLLKNVMAARRLQIAVQAAGAGAATVALAAMQPYAPPPRSGRCRMIAGTPQQQADALAELLLAAGAPA